ncbi:MAG: SgcJ/EcaC family oxidoreductase [Thermomicrobiales bacterium]
MTSKNAVSTRTDDERAVLAVLEGIYSAWAKNDADSFATWYVEDATVVMPGTYHKNRDEVRTYMAAAFNGPLKGSRGIDEPRNIRFLGDDTVIVISEAGILMAGETELPAERLRRATWVFTRQNDNWLIALYNNCPAN